MHIQNYRPDRPHVKCAKVTGETMAKFHPHGDLAIYDASVRMAQPFSLRDPLVDFHGNYGSPDFPPAASRYTECRLSPLALHMLESIDEETVDMGRNYLNEDDEPLVLPSRFPNLLVNGSQGIAVGMATNIPPHNLGEVIEATTHLIDNPDATIEDLMRFVKGPGLSHRRADSRPPGDHRCLSHRSRFDTNAGAGDDRRDAQRLSDRRHRTALSGQPACYPGAHCRTRK